MAELEFFASHGMVLDVEIPLSDISVEEITIVDDDRLTAHVGVQGSHIDSVEVWLYIDGSFRSKETVVLGSVGTSEIPLGTLSPGDHNVRVRVTTPHEYMGSDGYLLTNNEMERSVSVNEDTDNDIITLFVLMGASVLIIAGIILLVRGRKGVH